MEKEYYCVKICDLVDLDSNFSFLKENYSVLFELYKKRRKILIYEPFSKEKLSSLDQEIDFYHFEFHLPKYLIFEGVISSCYVRELFTKEEISFSLSYLDSCKIRKRGLLGRYLNDYSALEINQICADYAAFCEKKKNYKIYSFSNYKKVQ